MSIQIGQMITDGTAVFIIDDTRDGNRVGDIVLRHTLREGYIKANGAILQAADYPRLVQFVVDNNLSVSEADWQANMSGMYVYDGTAKTLRVPDLRGIFVQGADTAGQRIAAGLPNITGSHTLFFGQATSSSKSLHSSQRSSTFFNNSGGSLHQIFDLKLDASRSSAIYGKSNTVQPPAITLIAQIKY